MKIREFFGNIGTFRFVRDDVVMFTVRSLDDIINVIIPHFDKYPLLTQKKGDYLLFKIAALLMQKGSHLTAVGLQSYCKS